jgi:hypothetical protein
VGGGYIKFKNRFFKGQYFCKNESNAEGKESDTKNFKDFKKAEGINRPIFTGRFLRCCKKVDYEAE